ncbi:MAG: hypothetical protein LV481_02705 [Methylacidiphilales bacterium]|nr:hypothetical protein [Candidatus Methylacidiphilales bacterium]
MKSPVFPTTPAVRRSRQSMALVITLLFLALLSILLVSFVSISSLDRVATSSYAQALPADQIAQGGLAQVVSLLRAEIADPTLSTDYSSTLGNATNNLYIPTASTYAVPQRTAPYFSNLATLLSYSGTNLYTAGSGATDYSSSIPTTNLSANGRYISISRWSKPQLTTSTNNFPVPNWILVTRGGLQSFSTYNSTLANSAALNTNYVVGRYAYIVYDTSGLLDANVAGYSSGAAASAGGKGLMPWADLTQLTNSISQADVDNLVNWRNATTATPATSYVTNVYAAATNSGFMAVANGDTCFLSRQELIKYALQATNSVTGNADWTNALPYLTTFSRELNGPSWGPTTPAGDTKTTYAYAANQYTVGSFNPRIPNPRVQTGGWLRNNGLTAVAGEPLVKYRFPLDKLALLEATTNAAAWSANGTLIEKYFGLDYVTTGTEPSNGFYRHWNYPTTNSAYVHGVLSGTNGIMSLDDVATENREPDFFELLQAGMLSGSLGKPGVNSVTGFPNAGRYDKYPVNSSGSTSFVDPDDKATLQIMRIGANIIDQWGAENFPTTITYTLGSSTISVEGIKDLPYPCAAYFNVYASNSGVTGNPTATYTTPLPPFNFYLYFGLWNPHQAPSSVNSANYPTAFRFYPFYNSTENGAASLTCCDSFVAGFANDNIPSKPNTEESWFYNGGTTENGTSQTAHTYILMINSAPSGIPFSYAPTTSSDDYREPALAVGTAVGGTAPSPWNTNACLVLPPLTNFPNAGEKANHDGAAGFPSPSSGVGGPNYAWNCQYDVRFVMPVQFQDAAGNWHTYSTFAGIDDQGGAFPNGTYYEAYPAFGWGQPPTTPSLSCGVVMKCDPRTFRFGGGFGSSTNDVNLPLANSSGMPGGGVTMPPVSQFAPFGSSTPYRMDLWAENDSTNASGGYMDLDGVYRWGDAHNTYQLSTVTSPLFTGASANRPVILNRPFQSVAEMGYAFRDMPWKTLDLFSPNSADSGLLDLFTLSDAPITAGRVNPNTPYPQVLAALISGATMSTSNGAVSSANALTVANAITNVTTTTPFVSPADMVNEFMTNSAITTMAPTRIKAEEEAAVRAIAESANTRTWNFLIDIIGQSGRYPTSASSLNNFVVEGERRYWLHVAIDRYTGQVVAQQLEVVNE